MRKFTITYYVELDVPEGIDGRMEAFYWHDKVLRDSRTELPEHVYWVRTLPEVKEEE
jgi:hypothetical protein